MNNFKILNKIILKDSVYFINRSFKEKEGYVWPKVSTIGTDIPVSNYIDTGIKPINLSNNYKYEIKFKFNSILNGTSILGVRTSQVRGGNLYVSSNQLRLYIGNGILYTLNKTLDTSIHTTSLEVDKINKKCKWIYDNEVVFNSSYTGDVNSNASWYLGGSNINNEFTEKSNITVYRFKIWDGDKLILDLKPIIDPNSNTIMINLLNDATFNLKS